MSQRTSLRFSLLLSFLLVSVIPLILTGGLALHYAVLEKKRDVHERNELLADAARHRIEAVLDQSEVVLNYLSIFEDTHVNDNPQESRSLLDQTVRRGGFFESIILVNEEGVVRDLGLNELDARARQEYIGLDLSGQPFMQEIRTRHGTVWSRAAMSLISGDLSLAVAVASPGGYMVGNITLDRFHKIIRDIQVHPNTIISVIDQDGVLIFHPDRHLTDQRVSLRHLEPVRRALAGSYGPAEFENDGQRWVGSAMPVRETGWIILVSEPETSAYRGITDVRLAIGLGIALAILAAVLSALLLSRRLIRPLAQFGAMADAISAGQYGAPVPHFAHREIQRAAKSLTRMASAIEDRERRILISQNSLEAQVHFQQTLIDSVAVPLVFTGREGRCLGCNRAFEGVCGISKDSVVGKSLQDIVARDSAEALRRGDESLFASGGILNYEARLAMADGIRRDMIIHKTTFEDRQGRVAGIISALSDITEQRQTAQSLQHELTVNQAIGDLSGILMDHTSSLGEVAAMTLRYARALTDSSHGFVGVAEPGTGTIIGQNLTDMMGRDCHVSGADSRISFPVGPDGRYPGLWGHALNTREGFFSNTPSSHPASKGIPEGHVPLTSYLAVPALIGQEVMGEIALANSSRPYTERDLRAIDRLARLFSLAVQRLRMEEQIRRSLEEKVVLLREVHHRVKNNFQVISSLFRLQSRSEGDARLKEILTESEHRIRSMSMVHERLYDSEDFSRIDARDYLVSLVNDLIQTYRMSPRVSAKIEIEKIPLSVDTAIPCGLIVNELVSNALKHAFPSGGPGEIRIHFRSTQSPEETPPVYELTVADNGIGLPEGFDPTSTRTLGVHLVRTMAEHQLRGRLEVSGEGGTLIRIVFRNRG